MNAKLRMLLDFGPLLCFFLAYRIAGRYWPPVGEAHGMAPQALMAATCALIAATLLALLVIYYYERKIALLPLISGIAVTVFGGLTLFLHDEYFIKIKPTLLNLLFSSILLGGLYFRRPMLKYLFESAFQLTEDGWRKLSLRWGLFFLFLAGLNEAVWRHFDTDFWVNFKVFGIFSLTMCFTLCQIPLIRRYWVEEEK